MENIGLIIGVELLKINFNRIEKKLINIRLLINNKVKMNNDDNIYVFFLNEISNYCRLNPMDNICIGIGTNPRVNILEEFTPKIDQVIMNFLYKLDGTLRIIHFDELIKYNITFLHQYFHSKNFVYDNTMEQNNMYIWRSSDYKIEIIINCYNFYYEQYKPFLCDLVEMTLKNSNKLSKMFLQDFSGGNSFDMFKELYDESINKDKFKQRILFDITYGKNQCDIDLLVYEPIYDQNNNILNILLMNINELRPYLDYHSLIKDHIYKFYEKKYRDITNIIPVDFRRKMLIEIKNENHKLVCYKNLYTISSSYQDIINILRNELFIIIDIFKEIKFMTPEKEKYIEELLTNYKDYTFESKLTIYDWSTGFNKILN